MLKTNKKSKKGIIKRGLSKLNPNTGKKKILLFVILFGIAGGGYFAYKSFALSQIVYITPKCKEGQSTNNCAEKKESGKGNHPVVDLLGAGATSYGITATTPVPQSRARICVLLKPLANTGFFLYGQTSSQYVDGPVSYIPSKTFLVPKSDNYQTYCTDWGTQYGSGDYAFGSLSIEGTGAVRISFFSMEYE